MNRIVFVLACATGAAAIAWMANSFAGQQTLALAVTLLIGLAYLIGVVELVGYRRGTAQLAAVLATPPPATVTEEALAQWLAPLPPALNGPALQRARGIDRGFPVPVITPYLLGLLVMLGLLGTFFGMVEALSGAVTALQRSTELAAVRQGLAAPISGLGMAFGTSVAGVAGSAALGLAATLCRRERLLVVRTLDQLAQGPLRHLGQGARQLAAYRAIEQQAAALPEVSAQLANLVEVLSKQQRESNELLASRQRELVEETGAAYRALAESVDRSLRSSLATSGREVAEHMAPRLESAMQQFSRSAGEQQTALVQQAREQLEEIGAGFARLDARLESQREAAASAQAGQSEALLERVATAMAAQAESQQETLKSQSGALLARIDELLTGTETLVSARHDAEAAWGERQQAEVDALLAAIKEEFQRLRETERQRTVEAASQLEALQASAGEHLLQLGRGLEEPLARLLDSAAEAPRAAAEVIAELREELARSMERDNQTLEEREALLARMQGLTEALENSQREQQVQQQELIKTATGSLGEVAESFREEARQGSTQLSDSAASLAASSVEVASLGEAFQAGVSQFSEANRELIDSLARIEQAMEQAGARSDEQLGYYVAQAREVIDHSLLSQKEIIEELRNLGRQSDLFAAEEA